jgi:low affinity Fe/Cu permease
MKEAAKVMAEYTSRWVVGVYYVCQVILVIGFGDMITFSTAEIYLLIFMAVFGTKMTRL